MIKIQYPFEIKSSHSMNIQGCKARNQYELVCEKLENFAYGNIGHVTV